jgi:SAM-dependent methyltransferase
MRLNLGSGFRLKKGFTNVDIIPEDEVKKKAYGRYVYGDIHNLPFEDNVADYAEMYTVIEHIPFKEVVDVLKEIRRVMKKGAKLVIVTDDFDGIALDWIKMRMMPFNLERYQDVMETVYGSQRYPGDEHKSPMTYDFLNWALVTAGFKKGEFIKYSKGTPIPKIGTEKARKDMVFRNDMLIAEVVK